MPIVPDTKDWTWVLERPCPDCGFDASALDREAVGPTICSIGERWRDVLAQGDAVRRRPSDHEWSPLEYACHVRDVFRITDVRLSLMLERDDPTYPNWDQDATAIEDRYAEQDPRVVADELEVEASRLAERFDELSTAQWERPGARSDGARFTVESFARYVIHDPVHHLHDVGASTPPVER